MNFTRIITAMIMGISYASNIAQPVLTVANTPQPGSTYIFQSVNWNDTPITTDGVELTWDFSSVAIEDDTLAVSYTSDPGFNSFPGACFLEEPSNTDSALLRTKDYIYRVTDTSLVLSFAKSCGHFYATLGCVMQLDFTKLRFPFHLMDSIHENWSHFDRAGYIDVRAASYGTLILPDTTYLNCLLVHTMLYDYANYDTHGGHIHSMSYSDDHYEWYTTNAEVPVFSVYKGMAVDVYYMGPSFSFYKSAFMLNRKQIDTHIEIIAQAPPLCIYPNPTKGIIEFRSDLEFDKITILDIHGRSIRTVPSSSTQIDIGDLPAGLYFIQFISANSVLTQRLIKQ